MIYHLAICDDEAVQRKYLSRAAADWGSREGHEIRIDTFESAEGFLFHYEEDKSYDILLLDIEMGGMDGIQLARKIRTDNEQLQIIFITGYEEYIAEGYEVEALHYLLKPLDERKLAAALERAARRLDKTEPALLFTADGESFRIAVSDILFAEAYGHTTVIVSRRGRFELRETLDRTQQKLGADFVRTHRSCAVNLRAVKRITKDSAVLEDGSCVPLSRRLYQQVNHAFIEYYRRQGHEIF